MVGPVYVADGAQAARTGELDGLTLLFHRASGLTHFLAAPAPQILAVLADRPGDLENIVARLSERFELDGDAAGALAARLQELEAAGLVRRL